MSTNNNFILQQIHRSDDTSKISLGNPSYVPLKIFLKKYAYDFHQYEIAKTYVLLNPELSGRRVWGYITLMTSEVFLNQKQRPSEIADALKYEVYPAVKIARLAVDKSLHGKGYGRMLLDWCVNHLQVSIMPAVGCRFLVVDAKRESIPFYQKGGFELLDSEINQTEEHPQMLYDLYRSNKFIREEDSVRSLTNAT